MNNQVVLALLAAGAIASTASAQTVSTVLSTNLFEPHSVAVDPVKNDLYLTDAANNRIVKYAADSATLISLAGAKGQPGFANDTGTRARFSQPQGIAWARRGLVVADSANQLIRFVTTNGAVSTLAGGLQERSFADGNGTAARFNFPIGLAADADGNVYVADSFNNAVRKLDVNNEVTTLALGFNKPAGVAVGDNGELWIADTLNHVIKHLDANGLVTVVAGTPGVAGACDADFAASALFNSPQGLIWAGADTGLLVSDTGNHAVRRVFFNPDLGSYSVLTLAGTLAQPGLVDGPLNTARFNSPVGLGKDRVGGFLVVDLANNALRRIQRTAPLPPISAPAIGKVDFVKDSFGELLSILTPVSQAVFNNDITIAILSEPGTETFYTFGQTPSGFESTIPDPTPTTGTTPVPYQNGLHPEEVGPSLIAPQPDVTIKARSFADGRQPSAQTEARFQFKAGNPILIGDNAAAFVISNITDRAVMWYTTDGSDPTNNNDPSITNRNVSSIGPIASGAKVSLIIKTNITVRARAFRQNYKPSEIIQKEFSASNSIPNRITFGFEAGEASSDFIAAAGQTFYAPVTLSLVAGQRIYSLQFAMTNSVSTNSPGAPSIVPGGYGFVSMLKKPIPGTTPQRYVTIQPAMYTNGALQDLTFTNSSENLIGVGWLERYGYANLYDTLSQDLIKFSQARDTIFLSANQQVIVGAYSFKIPSNATSSDLYRIALSRPSATEDGVSADVYIDTPAEGPITAVKDVRIGNRFYIVGDVAPFRWFNAGDFGEGDILNNDVMQVFVCAAYSNPPTLHNPPPLDSDLFDAMDSSNGASFPMTNLLNGDDTTINAIAYGDGQLNVDDVFVTYRRSLDPSLAWFARYWTNGVRMATNSEAFGITNHFRSSLGLQASRPRRQLSLASLQAPARLTGALPSVAFAVGPVHGAGGEAVVAPIQAQITGDYPVRVLMMNLQVVPLNGAPPLSEPVQFVPVAELGQPTLTSSSGPDNYAAAWLDNTVPGLYGTNLVGNLRVTLPESAGPDASYQIEFIHISASPNGVVLFPPPNQTAFALQSNPDVSSWGDGIPDSWRLQYFGTLADPDSAAGADPDGDSFANLAEFKAGTNPRDRASRLQLLGAEWRSGDTSAGSGIVLRWPTVMGRKYTLECTSDAVSNVWTPVASNLAGDGGIREFIHTDIASKAQFYRVRIAD